jgi:hypothetical protein
MTNTAAYSRVAVFDRRIVTKLSSQEFSAVQSYRRKDEGMPDLVARPASKI